MSGWLCVFQSWLAHQAHRLVRQSFSHGVLFSHNWHTWHTKSCARCARLLGVRFRMPLWHTIWCVRCAVCLVCVLVNPVHEQEIGTNSATNLFQCYYYCIKAVHFMAEVAHFHSSKHGGVLGSFQWFIFSVKGKLAKNLSCWCAGKLPTLLK